MKLSGQTVLITGGASGIGLALTERFVQNGNRVIVIGRNADKLERLKIEYPSLTVYRCDLAVRDQFEDLIQRICDEHPDLNVIINNAGIQHNYSFIDPPSSSNRIAEEITVNLTSPIELLSRLIPLLMSHKEAAIVNVSSGLGLVPKKSAPVYCATKAGLHIFTKALRYQLENTNIKVFEIIPPIVDTDMTRGRGQNKISPDQLVVQFLAHYRRNRLVVPIGKVKLLLLIQRWWPTLADKILKNS
ncbi:SDR family oxidoreductase [Cohnella herbarum]|uniref:SDR family NAD(P)-dependent oxidoreductase n=1 Tax=Cohnella herbarum TaxID=2728023 RepID=A0A7Z2VLN8_9BACL|nr:SDR family oxidoreductase [Cohnella herbarum]QJD85533.1 SDR family NAD(P)-dependent oxidoreductase [Cohnella herbarum]